MEQYEYVPLEALKKFKEYYDTQEGRKYPCSNQIVVCGIITDDRNLAIDFMKDKPVVETYLRKDGITWRLDNGEKWVWRHWNESCRGHRFYKVAIDKFIRREIFEYLVQPYCGLYCCSVEII